MYNVILWKDNDNEDIHVFENKPTFLDLYPLINCEIIQITKGYTKELGTFEMHTDEEAKFNNLNYPNKRATEAWYAWQKRTKRTCLPGDHIVGSVAIVLKQKFKPKVLTEDEINAMKGN